MQEMEKIMMGEALRLIRVFHEVKQAELARRLGISKSYLSEIEKGSKEPTLSLVEKYAAQFELPASSIMFFAENVNSTSSYEAARRLVASKVVKLLKFLESRSGGDDEK
jgi:transcriptional regulator with XRE-family HTH domain